MPNYNHAPKEINPHYNREFDLLMSGEKKIAVFSTGFFADSDWPDERYENAVATSELEKLDFKETFRYREVRYIYYYYPENSEEVERLRKLFQLDFSFEDSEAIEIEKEIGTLLGYSDLEIQEWLNFFDIGVERDKLLYPHRGEELELMLKGEKPLAKFADFIDPARGEATNIRWADEEFSSFVKKGKFIRKEFIKESNDDHSNVAHVQHLYFSTPKEAWRIDEMYDLDKQDYTYRDERSRNYSRREGQLLGYSQEEIEAYIDHYYGYLE